VHVAIDTSGSISSVDVRDFLSEVKGIMDQFVDYRVTVWCFDTQTYTVWEFTPDNEDELENFVPEGGGGTLFECNWDMMKAEGIMPSTFIMFTDLYPGRSYGDPDYCDTVFLAKGNPNGQAPFGVTVHYEKQKIHA
jgi:predicted metal-dependent peptidase